MTSIQPSDTTNMAIQPMSTDYLLAGSWLFSPSHQRITTPDGQTIALRKKNAEVLLALVKCHNQTVTTEQLYQQVWGSKVVSEGVIKRSICDLRNVFTDDDKSLIVTVPKLGYRLSMNVEISQSEASEPQVAEPPVNPSRPSSQSQPRQRLIWPIWAIGLSLLLLNAYAWYSDKAVEPEQPTAQSTPQSTILLRDVIDIIDDKAQLDAALGKVVDKLSAIGKGNPQRIELAFQLIDAYIHAGSPDKAAIATEKIVRDAEMQYGEHHPTTLKVRHRAVDALTMAGRRQEAHSMAQFALESNLKHHSQDKTLLADSYYRYAVVKLQCTYPSCNRVDAVNSGLEAIDKAIALLESQGLAKDVTMADALVLKNWFTVHAAAKLDLLDRALAIYLSELGEFDIKVAHALLQRGRTRINWQLQPQQAPDDLQQALMILTFLYGDQHHSVKKVKRVLAEQFMYSLQFDKVVDYLSQAIKPEQPGFTCPDKPCLDTLLMLTKAYLYHGNRDKARDLLPLFERSVEQHDMKLSFSLAKEIEIVTMRVETTEARSGLPLNDIIANVDHARVAGLAAKNAYTGYTLGHEWMTVQLINYPQSLDDDKYIAGWQEIGLNTFNPYATPADKRFLFQRAMAYCARNSEALCKKIRRNLPYDMQYGEGDRYLSQADDPQRPLQTLVPE